MTADQLQWLVRVRNKTYTVNTTNHGDSERLSSQLIDSVSSQTGWPTERLELCNDNLETAFPFVSVRIVSSLLGGKGGFGTLLKGQSKQAGARITTDYGACRDLQGRRLRHINDEIKLRKWREMERRKQNKEEVSEDYMMDTPSGLYNWYLMVPNWAALSNKATKKVQNKVKGHYNRWRSEEEKVKDAKRAKEERYHRGVEDYVRETNSASTSLSVMDAVQQGLAAKKRQREEEEGTEKTAKPTNGGVDPKNGATNDNDNDNDIPLDENTSSLLTLSGELVVEKDAASWKVQSKSDFGTMALVLEKNPSGKTLYWEVELEQGGLAQIGWADLSVFRPDSEEGNGVGDDKGSYGYDGSRKQKFHAGKEESYGKTKWKAGDTIGCIYKTGKLRYTLNGKDNLGVAFEVPKDAVLVPAVSCNQGQILDIRTASSQMKHLPDGYTAVGDLMQDEAEGSSIEDRKKPASKTATSMAPPEKKAKTEPTAVLKEPLDLAKYKTVDKLKTVGMDRLKGALMAIQVKCGGSLDERAKRLFSLKGLERKDYPQKVRAKNFVV